MVLQYLIWLLKTDSILVFRTLRKELLNSLFSPKIDLCVLKRKLENLLHQKCFYLLDLLTNEKPDERQIMTYVSCYYHAFQGAMQVHVLGTAT